MAAYRIFAFISYSHRDLAVAKWLQRKLERFRLPVEIHNEIDARCRYLRPVFRDQSDLDSGILSQELSRHLQESKYLIIICSKHSAASDWVSREADAFVAMGRLDRIIPVIVPDGDTPEIQLFPRSLREYFQAHPEYELLGVNIGEVGREKALVRVVSRMLGVSFDSLWKRHLRQLRRRIAIVSALALAATAVTYLFAIPVEVYVSVRLQQALLPLGDHVTLKFNGAEYLSSAPEPHFDRIRLPGYRRFSSISTSVSSPFYNTVDTMVPIGLGLRRHITVELRRDDSFAIFAGRVCDDELMPLAGVAVTVAGHRTATGTDGSFYVALPLGEQSHQQPIMLEKTGYATLERLDEAPSPDLRYIMHREL